MHTKIPATYGQQQERLDQELVDVLLAISDKSRQIATRLLAFKQQGSQKGVRHGNI